jgi:hypothetical protein
MEVSDGAGEGSVAVFISGDFIVEFPTKSRKVRLSRPGDYVMYGPDVPHSWHALTDSVVLTARWHAIG